MIYTQIKREIDGEVFTANVFFNADVDNGYSIHYFQDNQRIHIAKVNYNDHPEMMLECQAIANDFLDAIQGYRNRFAN